MPGILPMKVIKVGTSAQSRIAQACDRCRSKKIRCDGFRPTCTQCSNVGFECKTSDKLSRRAFPRGYTESLEERVRVLEGEVRELKDLLDEKDEKIEMLSKMHAHSPRRSSVASSRKTSSVMPASVVTGKHHMTNDALQQHDGDSTFKLQQSPYLLLGDNTDHYFMGNSSTRAFVVNFKRRLQDVGLPSCDFKIDTFFLPPPSTNIPPLLPSFDASLWTPPSRLNSDRMVNIFFQEWAPLFPILHRPAFLALYERCVSNSANVQDKKSVAQLNLVFGIAALSNDARIDHSAELCERQWTAALDHFAKDTSMVTLQCLVLAQIYCIQKGDFDRLLHYKGLAIAIAQRLGLHLSQKRFALGVLTVETRKKVFWSLYTLDCFSSAILGLPKSLREDDIYCEYPVDADDEYVTENGFQPTLPGEFTKISSALALFRGCRIMAKVLEQNYPCAASHELSLHSIAALDDELEAWSSNLPHHLKLDFVQDKPSTNTISSRSPLLSLTYNYIRTLIHRPAICANLGERAVSSAVSLSIANKQIIQIVQLLDERNLSFSHCLNKNELLLSAGVGLLFQSLDLHHDGKLMKDNQRLVCYVMKIFEARNFVGAVEFRELGCSILLLPQSPSTESEVVPRKKRSTAVSPPIDASMSHKQLAILAARYSQAASQGKQKIAKASRKPESPESSASDNQPSRTSERGLRPLAPSVACRNSSSSDSSSVGNPSVEVTRASPRVSRHETPQGAGTPRHSSTNLDYFSFSDEPASKARIRKENAVEPTVWETLLHSLESSTFTNQDNASDSVYDWPPVETLLSPTGLEPRAPSTKYGSDAAWSPDVWNSGNDCLSVPPQSVLSLSDESLTSGEEYSSLDHCSVRSDSLYQNAVVSGMTPEDFADLETFAESNELRC